MLFYRPSVWNSVVGSSAHARLSRYLMVLLIAMISASVASGATFTVTNVNDTGAGSLRQAILDANAVSSNDVIEFDPVVFRSQQSIFLASGGVSIANNGTLQINGTGADVLALLGNQTSVVFTSFGSNVTINALTIANGAASDTEGGGIYNRGTLTINNLVVKDNFATFSGGGIYNTGTLTVNNSTITANKGSGISMPNSGSSATVNNSVVSYNTASGIGTNGPLTVNNSTIFENRSGGLGSFNGNITLNNSTVSGNYGRTVGSGISIFGAVLTMINSTVAFNRADAGNGGGIMLEGSATATARNTIIARNTGNAQPSDFQGTLSSQGYNLIGSTAFMTITGNTTGNILNVDPNLQPLANYGGPSPTHSLFESSPAIDAGDPVDIFPADQRGVTRPFDGNNDGNARADIGAVEVGYLVTNVNNSGAGSLRQVIAAANSTAAIDEIRFSSLFDTPRTIALLSTLFVEGGTLLINGPGIQTLAVSGSNANSVFQVNSEGTLSIQRLSLIGGFSSAGGGGAIANPAECTTHISEVAMTGNISGVGGGALVNTGTMTVTDSIVHANTTLGNGGGIWNFGGGTLVIKRSTLTGNSGIDGGAINNAGILTVIDSTISGNSTQSSGGGIRNSADQVSIIRTLISGNTSEEEGGGVYSTGSGLSIFDSTISGNASTGSSGGGIYLPSGTMNLTNLTVAFNSAMSGGGIGNGSGTANLRSTIIAKNVASSSDPDISGSVNSLGYNLIGNTTGTTITGTATGNQLGVDPLLSPLAANGGRSETHKLSVNSPGIDAGDPLVYSSTDQRGYNRITDGNSDGTARTDIGAYELGTVVGNVSDSGPGSLRQAIFDARISIGTDEINFSSVFDTPQTIVLTSSELLVGAGGPLTINGFGNLTISGNNQRRIFNIAAYGDLTLTGVTVADGRVLNGDGGAIFSLGKLTLSNSTVRNSTANGGGSEVRGGAGIYNGGGTLRANNSVIRNNILTGGTGSGILTNRGTVELVDSTLSSNTGGSNGGGLANHFGLVSLLRSTVASSTSSGAGGIFNIGTLNLDRSLIDGNTGGSYGGIYNGTVLNVLDSTVSNNKSNNDGGGLFNQGAATITGSTFSGNIAVSGAGINSNGGINNDRGPLKIINSTISGNKASESGGGLKTVVGVATLTNVTIAFNTATVSGGGVQSFDTNLSARTSLIARNIANNIPSDFLGTLTSSGYNFIGTTAGTTINGDSTGNQLNADPRLDPLLRNAGGPTKLHALRITSPAIDKGATASGGSVDQRGLARPFDMPDAPNAPGGNGSDIGAFERQANDVTGLPVFDFDGDGKTDVSIFRPSVGEWWIYQSLSGTAFAAQFGASTDKIVPADFTGDGKTDIAIWRPVTGEWIVLRSENNTYYSAPFGAATDIPAPADYDADGKADLAVYRPSTGYWFINRSSDGGLTSAPFGGNPGDIPIPADYDGDGKTDLGIYYVAGGEWWLNRSTAGLIVYQFGNSSDKIVPGDYTGDGKTDVAFWRPVTGEWFVLRSEDSSYYSAPFGASDDIPAPGDYDGDGKFDFTVFRPSTGYWFVNRSSGGTSATPWGTVGDRPIPTAFLP